MKGTAARMMIVAVVQFGLTSGQTQTNPRPANVPSDLLATIQSNPAVKECIQQEHLLPDKIVRTTSFNLNRPQQAVVLVEGLGPCLSGNVNHNIWLYVRAGNGWRVVLDGIGAKLERISSDAHGWPDLYLWQHDSAFDSVQVLYRYDGNVYKPTVCKVVEFADPLTAGRHAQPASRPCDWDWKARQ